MTIDATLQGLGFQLVESVRNPAGDGVRVQYARPAQLHSDPDGQTERPACLVTYVTADPIGHQVSLLEVLLTCKFSNGEDLSLEVQGLVYDDSFAAQLETLGARLLSARDATPTR